MKGKCSDCKVCLAYMNEIQNHRDNKPSSVSPDCAVAGKNRAGIDRPETKGKLKRKNF
jgi:hypothetical protein